MKCNFLFSLNVLLEDVERLNKYYQEIRQRETQIDKITWQQSPFIREEYKICISFLSSAW